MGPNDLTPTERDFFLDDSFVEGPQAKPGTYPGRRPQVDSSSTSTSKALNGILNRTSPPPFPGTPNTPGRHRVTLHVAPRYICSMSVNPPLWPSSICPVLVEPALRSTTTSIQSPERFRTRRVKVRCPSPFASVFENWHLFTRQIVRVGPKKRDVFPCHLRVPFSFT